MAGDPAWAPAWIDADEARIELFITCLLDNACKYTPPSGSITLEVAVEDGFSVLRVRDTGVGIAAELAESMVEAFAQGDRGIERSEGGLGLGLALVRQLIHLHDGAIAAFSDGEGQGSTFSVAFPRATALLESAEAAAAATSDELLLTIVEDIEDNREMMLLLLEAERFEATLLKGLQAKEMTGRR